MRVRILCARPPEQSAQRRTCYFGLGRAWFNVELVPAVRIVQAWRAASWLAGNFSSTKFVLLKVAGGTRLVFDHAGFPGEAADHLARGWHVNYWEPLARVLASP